MHRNFSEADLSSTMLKVFCKNQREKDLLGFGFIFSSMAYPFPYFSSAEPSKWSEKCT